MLQKDIKKTRGKDKTKKNINQLRNMGEAYKL